MKIIKLEKAPDEAQNSNESAQKSCLPLGFDSVGV
jgi:hypothetical protein